MLRRLEELGLHDTLSQLGATRPIFEIETAVILQLSLAHLRAERLLSALELVLGRTRNEGGAWLDPPADESEPRVELQGGSAGLAVAATFAAHAPLSVPP